MMDYIDDYVSVGVPSVTWKSYDTLTQLMQELGLAISSKKLLLFPMKSLNRSTRLSLNGSVRTWCRSVNCNPSWVSIFLNRMLELLRNSGGR